MGRYANFFWLVVVFIGVCYYFHLDGIGALASIGAGIDKSFDFPPGTSYTCSFLFLCIYLFGGTSSSKKYK